MALRASDRGRVPAPRPGPRGALRLAQITPAKLQQPDGRITARQMEVLSGAAMQELDDEALGAFSRRLPWGSYGMLARASLSVARPGHRAQALVPPSRAADRRRPAGPGGDRRERRHRDRRARPLGGRSARVLPGARAAQRAWAGLLVHRLAHPAAGRALSFPGAAARRRLPAACSPARCSFDAAQAEIRFDARYLALPLRRDEKALRQMLQRALPLTVLPVPARPPAGAAGAPGAGRASRTAATAPRPGGAAAHVAAHAASPAEGRRREPAAAEGRSAAASARRTCSIAAASRSSRSRRRWGFATRRVSSARSRAGPAPRPWPSRSLTRLEAAPSNRRSRNSRYLRVDAPGMRDRTHVAHAGLRRHVMFGSVSCSTRTTDSDDSGESSPYRHSTGMASERSVDTGMIS